MLLRSFLTVWPKRLAASFHFHYNKAENVKEKESDNPMMREFSFILFGYLTGSILFARLAGQLFHCGDITANSPDHNPGTFNAFRNGGFGCGMTALLGDILKGLLPVWLYQAGAEGVSGPLFPFVLAAPVIGHIFPLYHHFCGGKGIATTFGCLLGLLPEYRPVLILAFCFLFSSCVVRITPHFYRTLFTYLCSGIILLFLERHFRITLGFLLIMAAVGIRFLTSREEKEACKVEFVWKH